MQNMKNSISRNYGNIREYLTPVLENTNFINKGVLTPEEFVKAGDFLIKNSPDWNWGIGNPDYNKEYLPEKKQFLIIENISCYQRVKDNFNNYNEKEIEHSENSEGWLKTNITEKKNKVKIEKKDKGDDDYESFLQSMEEEDLGVDNSVMIDSANFINIRNYNISITYDKYYQTPRLWLSGFSDNGQPLSYTEIFEDIMSDYANKTVTIEKHPHILDNMIYAAIHPCQHSKVMKILINNTVMSGRMPLVEEYLIFFLKFMSSIMPYITFDNTKPLIF